MEFIYFEIEGVRYISKKRDYIKKPQNLISWLYGNKITKVITPTIIY